MPNLRVDSIKSSDGTKGPVITGNVVFSGTSHIVLPKGTTAQRPSGVAAGSLRFNTDTKLVEQYNGTEWVTLNSYGVGRGVFGGGYTPTDVNTLDYITISTLGDASTFGNLTQARRFSAACSSSTRGVFGGGVTFVSPILTLYNIIDYITISTTGNSTDFGDLISTRVQLAACSSSTRGVFGGGTTPSNVNTIDYITIATTGNATDFGDLTQVRIDVSGCSSSTRGVFGGGYSTPTTVNTIDYITIATTGNATDFGDLTSTKGGFGSCSSSTRGVFGSGYTGASPSFPIVNTIEYITIATTGNAQDFGDSFQTRQYTSSCSNSTRGVFGGGATPTIVNTLDYITIASNGTNAQDFGDLTQARLGLSACSDSHGGLS